MKPVQSVQSLMNKARVEKPWTGCFCVPLEWHALACTRPCRPRLQLAACTVRPPHPALVYCGTRPLLQVPQHLFRLGVCEKKKKKNKKTYRAAGRNASKMRMALLSTRFAGYGSAQVLQSAAHSQCAQALLPPPPCKSSSRCVSCRRVLAINRMYDIGHIPVHTNVGSSY